MFRVNPEHNFATSFGVAQFRAECGLSWLYDFRHFSVKNRASFRLENKFSFKHSSRNRPLNDSIKHFEKAYQAQ